MFTCISCRVAFETADEQRSHFATDWHRYNMKRRVAELPPLPAHSFNEKVLERREQNAVKVDPRGLICTPCGKSFSTENAFRSHVQSRKHRDREASVAGQSSLSAATPPAKPVQADVSRVEEVSDGSGSDEEDHDIEERLAASRRRIQPTQCLFCSTRGESIQDAVDHMRRRHGFFIPDQEHLVDLPGLLSYLGEKVVIGNLCLYCPNGGREFGSLEAVRNHMMDRGHCKLAYEGEEDQAEVAEFYDFGDDGSDWEDEESGDEREYEKQARTASLAADGYSLVLPSGKILGHRDLKVYYSQRLGHSIPTSSAQRDRSLQVAALRQTLSDPSQPLISAAGDIGGFGRGLQVMKARNAGEAKWAKQQSRTFKGHAIREKNRDKVGMRNNNQKHFRDPLLQ